ncbi:MAG: potassium channel family protein [Capsulimonadaceae bacterium]
MTQSPYARLRLALAVAAVLCAIGTAGYYVIEHYSLLDALYMTVITLSTVGFGEVRPLDPPGKIFTIGLIVFGIVTATWVLSTVIEVLVSEDVIRLREQRNMKTLIDRMRGHFIVCGFGRIGQQIVEEYLRNRVPFVVMEIDEQRVEMMRARGLPYVEGDSSDEEALTRAGIAHAAGLIAVTSTDAGNTFIVLTARGMRSDLSIVARADTPPNVEKLYRAGASKVVSPHVLGGRWMGAAAVNPAITDFLTAMTQFDHTKLQMRELVVSNGEVVGRRFGELRLRERTGALVMALRSEGSKDFVPNPPDDFRFGNGDSLVVIGSPDQLVALAKIVHPDRPLKPLAVGTWTD